MNRLLALLLMALTCNAWSAPTVMFGLPFPFTPGTAPNAVAVNSSGQISLSLLAGENQTLNRMMVVRKATACSNMTTATTTTVATGAGVFTDLVVNKAVATGVITIYDNTAGSGTTIGTITFGAALLTDPPSSTYYGYPFATGLTIVTSQATNLTICYQQ